MHRDPLICRKNPDLAAKLDSYCQPQTLLILSIKLFKNVIPAFKIVMVFREAKLGVRLMPNKDEQTSLKQSFCRLASPKKLILDIKTVQTGSEL